jgi:hypothetical protein
MHSPAWAAPRREKYRFVKMFAYSILVISLAGWAFSNALPRHSKLQEPLRFTSNGSFQISIFEDLHTGEGLAILPTYERILLILHSCMA